MANLQQYNWLPTIGYTAAICATQTLVGAGNLVLNGTFASVQYPNVINVLAVGGTSRSISLTSVNNLSGINFVVNGYQNGVAVTSGNIVGPNNNTVTVSVVVFDVVTSVTANGAAAGISVGIGTTGYFPLVQFNLGDINQYRTGCHMRSWALSYTSAPQAIPSGLYATIADATQSSLSYSAMIANSSFQTIPNVAFYIGNIAAANFLITDSNRFFNQLLLVISGAGVNPAAIAQLNFRDS